MMHYFEDEQFAATMTRLVPVWEAVTGNDHLAEFMAVERPATFDPRTADWTRLGDAVRPIAEAMEGEAAAAGSALNAEQRTALGIVAHSALCAEWHTNPGPAWIADRVRDLQWAEQWLFWPYGC